MNLEKMGNAGKLNSYLFWKQRATAFQFSWQGGKSIVLLTLRLECKRRREGGILSCFALQLFHRLSFLIAAILVSF